MTKTKTGKQTSTKKKVVKPNAKAKLEKTNKKVIIQKVIVHRELKYIYPRGCKDTVLRKAFRQKVRNAIRKMERDIDKLKGEDRRVLKGKLTGYLQENLA